MECGLVAGCGEALFLYFFLFFGTICIHRWTFLATDVDLQSLKNADAVLQQNRLQHAVRLHHVADPVDIINNRVLGDVGGVFDFCMCNPPFFASTADRYVRTKMDINIVVHMDFYIIV